MPKTKGESMSRKKMTFLLITVFLFVMVFSLSATCGMCSIDLNGQGSTAQTGRSDELQGSETTESQESPVKDDQAGEDVQQEAVVDETYQEGERSDTGEENSRPYIETVAVNEIEIDPEGMMRVNTGQNLNFFVQAFDDDGDELEFSAHDNIGNMLDVTQLDNNHAGFGWSAPEEHGTYQVMIDVFDSRGAETSLIIDIEVIEAVAVSAKTCYVDSDLCGFIVKDTTVLQEAEWSFIGDSTSGIQVKGYIAFDISELAVMGQESIFFCQLKVELVNVNDYDFADNVIIKAYDYGNSLELSDYNDEGTFIASYPTSESSYDISNEALLDSVKKAVSAGKDYYQLKFSMDSAAKIDSVSDGKRINFNGTSLLISHEE